MFWNAFASLQVLISINSKASSRAEAPWESRELRNMRLEWLRNMDKIFDMMITNITHFEQKQVPREEIQNFGNTLYTNRNLFWRFISLSKIGNEESNTYRENFTNLYSYLCNFMVWNEGSSVKEITEYHLYCFLTADIITYLLNFSVFFFFQLCINK